MASIELETAPEPSKYTLGDVLTIPNAMTLSRILLAPWAYKAIAKRPAERWFRVGAASLTDLEGNAARLEDLPYIGKYLRKIGFRRSEIGREGDPVADVIYGAAVAAGGIKSGAIPKWIAKISLAQKAVKSSITVAATLEGKKLEVRNTGKAAEALTALGFYGCIASEAIEGPTLKSSAKVGSSVVALTGIAASSLATVGLAIDAGYMEAPRFEAMLTLCDVALERVTPGT